MANEPDDSIVRPRAGVLFLVATPIGNLADLSPRAHDTLRDADLLLAEDTRHTSQLLNACGIARPPGSVESLHEHNERARVSRVIERLLAGGRVALVSDAGTPLVSDPGAALVQAAAEAGVEVVTVPGPCAAIAALCLSGLPIERFSFEGFLPARSSARVKSLQALAHEQRTLVFYEAPHRLQESLTDLVQVFGADTARRGRARNHEAVRNHVPRHARLAGAARRGGAGHVARRNRARRARRRAAGVGERHRGGRPAARIAGGTAGFAGREDRGEDLGPPAKRPVRPRAHARHAAGDNTRRVAAGLYTARGSRPGNRCDFFAEESPGSMEQGAR